MKNNDNVYKQNGYRDRDDYLSSLAMEFNVPKYTVFALANTLGKNEDFDGLLCCLEDLEMCTE